GHQANAFDVAWATAALEAGRVALRGAASHLAAGRLGDAGWLATLAWLEARDAGLAATDLGVQLLGGHGYIHDHPAQRWYREARMLALLFGGVDAALDDLADRALDAPDPLVP
ncbi:MAG TPA: acyl-CoA dehydrogenase family protein, partial [Acidimicrobiales bacterium]|nr:acyl-CoA dehydrogenase family protein [Acidimicrobiales bacterium]